MAAIKNILARAWAFWGLIIFTITLLLFFIPFCICFLWPEPKRSRISYPIFRTWMDIFLPLVGVFIKIRGKEHFKTGENYIVVCNHRTLMDIPISSPQIPGPNKTIAKISFARIPIFGTAYKLGSVLVDRNDKDSRKNSYKKMKTVLEQGLHMCIYPEGTRNKSLQPLKEFQDGAFRLAVDSGKEIIPSLLFGTNKILPNNKSFYLWPGKIEFHFLASIPPGYNSKVLKEKTYEVMKAHYLDVTRQKSAK
jgi:1-acyl-sn-glycerol-3-phosphate acyltransferase